MLLVQQPDLWIAPRGAAKIPVQARVPKSDGRFSRQFFVRLATPAGQKTQATLELQGEAVASAKVFPSAVNFGAVGVQELACRSIRVGSRRIPDLRRAILSFRTDSSFVGVNVAECRADLLTLDVYLLPPLPFGTLNATIGVSLQHRDTRISLDIPLIASVTSDVYPVPKSLIIQSGRASVSETRLLELRSRQGRELDVLSVVCPPGIKVLEQLVDSSKVRIKFGIDSVKADRAEEPIVLRVKTDTTQTTLAVPVRWSK